MRSYTKTKVELNLNVGSSQAKESPIAFTANDNKTFRPLLLMFFEKCHSERESNQFCEMYDLYHIFRKTISHKPLVILINNCGQRTRRTLIT